MGVGLEYAISEVIQFGVRSRLRLCPGEKVVQVEGRRRMLLENRHLGCGVPGRCVRLSIPSTHDKFVLETAVNTTLVGSSEQALQSCVMGIGTREGQWSFLWT